MLDFFAVLDFFAGDFREVFFLGEEVFFLELDVLDDFFLDVFFLGLDFLELAIVLQRFVTLLREDPFLQGIKT